MFNQYISSYVIVFFFIVAIAIRVQSRRQKLAIHNLLLGTYIFHKNNFSFQVADYYMEDSQLSIQTYCALTLVPLVLVCQIRNLKVNEYQEIRREPCYVLHMSDIRGSRQCNNR